MRLEKIVKKRKKEKKKKEEEEKTRLYCGKATRKF